MAGKKNKNMTLILVVAILAIGFAVSQGNFFLGASVNQGGTSEIVRSLSVDETFTNEIVTVSYDVSIGPDTECSDGDTRLCNDFFIIDDQIPMEVKVTDISSPSCDLIPGSPQRMVCIILQDATSTTLSYKAEMPSTQQVVSFSGSYMIQGDGTHNSLYGDSEIIVNEIGGCVPNWVCTEYSDYTDGTCGVRTRTCVDENSCDSTIGQPEEIDTMPCQGPVCGDNQAETGEVCDGTDLNGLNCQALGDFSSGTLGCLPNCEGYDLVSCIPEDNGNDKGACISNWECEEWSSCIDGEQTRTCTDKEVCYAPTNVPDQKLSCGVSEKTDLTIVYVLGGAILLFLLMNNSKKKKKTSRKRRSK